MKNQERVLVALNFAFCVFLLTGPVAHAQDESENPRRSEGLIYSLQGADLFRAYCAPCHGLSGKGDGPAAQELKARVPDLTVLAKNNAGKFPSALLREFIAGDTIVLSHGTREMPIWGPIFHRVEEDADFGNVRLENVVQYLKTIQSDGTTHPASGAELYQQNCAICHGDDLKGGSAVPYPYRKAPDLTALARRHGGEFPEAYVSEVLRVGVILPAHGPAEMPVWGTAFREGERLNEAQINLKITELVKYIRSFQTKQDHFRNRPVCDKV